MSILRIQNLYKTFDRVVAVNRINLEIKEGEFFTLLGSSGCGKTTTLAHGRRTGETRRRSDLSCRPLPGAPTRKQLFVKPEKRDMGMVFQSYALWPHMTVFENVSYPLKLRGIKGAQAAKSCRSIGTGRPCRLRRATGSSAERRSAAARRARPCLSLLAESVVARRAAQQSRCATARRNAPGAESRCSSGFTSRSSS